MTHTLAGEYVGLEEVDDGLWDVYFGPVKLGRMNERILRIEDHKGRTVRRAPSLTTTEPIAICESEERAKNARLSSHTAW